MYVRKHLIVEVQPPRSPDLNPSDFKLWLNVKAQV